MNLRSSLTGVLILTFAVSAIPAKAGDRKHSTHFHKEAEVARAAAGPGTPAGQGRGAPPPPPPVVVEHHHDTDDWYVNLEAYYIEPRFSGNPAFLNHTDNGTTDFHGQTDFQYDLSFAPKISIGGGGGDGHVGIRATGFTMDDRADRVSTTDAVGASAAPSTANFIIQSAAPMGLGFYSTGTAAAPTTLTFGSRIALDTADLEATWSDHNNRVAWDLTGGVRYADLDQAYTATERSAAGATLSNVFSRTNFQGVGPTASAKASVRLRGDSGMALYGMGRGSILFGDGEQNATLGVTPIGATVRGIFTNHSKSEDIMPVAEMEIGAEWKRDWHEHKWALSVGVMAQNWFGAGNATGSETIVPRAGAAGTTTVTTPTGTANLTGASSAANGGVPTRQFDVDASDNDGNLGFLGLKVGLSVSF